MLSATTIDFTFDDDDWKAPLSSKLYGAGSGSWGVTSIGRGFNWTDDESSNLAAVTESPRPKLPPQSESPRHGSQFPSKLEGQSLVQPTPWTSFLPPTRSVDASSTSSFPMPVATSPEIRASSPPPASRSPTPPFPPPSRSASVSSFRQFGHARSPNALHPRRRSSQQRVSLIAGHVSIASIEPPVSPPLLPHSLSRAPSSSSTRAPSPNTDNQSFLGERSISEFAIEGEIGRGAYGLVKRARELQAGGTLGVGLSFASTNYF